MYEPQKLEYFFCAVTCKQICQKYSASLNVADQLSLNATFKTHVKMILEACSVYWLVIKAVSLLVCL